MASGCPWLGKCQVGGFFPKLDAFTSSPERDDAKSRYCTESHKDCVTTLNPGLAVCFHNHPCWRHSQILGAAKACDAEMKGLVACLFISKMLHMRCLFLILLDGLTGRLDMSMVPVC